MTARTEPIERIDLTRPLREGISVYPGDPLFQARPFAEHTTDGYRGTVWTLGSHLGTHLDAPFHFFIDGETLDSFPVDFFFGVAATLDLTPLVGAGSPRASAPRRVGRPISIEIADLEPFEPIFAAADFVFLRTGWATRFGLDDYYTDFPSLTPETADWLDDFPKLRILGLETPSLVAFPTFAAPPESDSAGSDEPTAPETAARPDKTRSFDPDFLPESATATRRPEPATEPDARTAAPDSPLDERELCADAECHRILLGRRPPILILEGLVGLERLPAFAPPTVPGAKVPFDPAKTAFVSCLPLPIEGADGCPVRVVAEIASNASEPR